MANSKTRAIQDGPPLDELNKLVDNDAKAAIHIWRVNASGKKQSTGGHETWDPIDLTTHKLVDRIKKEFGGGVFLIEVCDPEQVSKRIAPSFKLHIEGEPGFLPKQAGKFEAALIDYEVNGRVGPPPDPRSFIRGPDGTPPLRAGGTQHQLPPQVLDPRRYWEKTPDAIAQEQAYTLQAKLDQIEKAREADRQKFEEERRRYETREKDILGEISKMRDEFRKEQDEAKNAALMAEIARIKETKPPTTDYAALIAAAAPIIATFMQTTATREELRHKQESKSLEIQQKNADNMLKLMASKAANETEGLKAIMPMITKTLDDKSPKAQATLMSVMSEHQATMLSMIHQIMQSQQPDNPPPWMEFANEAIGQLSQVASAYAQTQAEMAKQPPQPVAATLTSALTDGTANQDEVVEQPEEQALPEPAELAELILKDPRWPDALRNDEWQVILELIHDEREPATIVQYINAELTKLIEANALPDVFNEVYANPEIVIYSWLGMLPIGRINSAYCRDVAYAFAALVHNGPQIAVEESEASEAPAQAEIVDTIPEENV